MFLLIFALTSRLVLGVFRVFVHNRRHADDTIRKQARQTIPHVVDAVDMLRLLYIDRTDRDLLDERETHNLVDGVGTVPYNHFHVVVRHNACRMDTFNRNISHEVSTRIYVLY